MYYSDEVIEEVRSRSDILAVVSEHVKMTKRGDRYFGCCPFHNEKTPSFSVSPSKQVYYCFGCGAGGSVFTFVMEYENYTFQEAVKYLADRAGVRLPEEEPTREEREREGLRTRLLAANRDAATFYFRLLRAPGGRRGWDYFIRRGLSAETIRRFGLGYSPSSRDTLYQFLKGKGYSDEILSRSGLVKITEKGPADRFWNRVMFPIMDANSRVIGFGGRVMGKGEPKYLNSPETPLFDKSRNIYGLNLARSSRRPYFLLCEGYMDVIALHQAGFDCAVASLGTALTEGHARLIKRYGKEVILTYDNDEAGTKAAMRAIPILQDAGLSVRVLDLSPYNDPDEFLTHEGPGVYQERIDTAVNSFLFESDVVRARYDFSDPEQKTRFHREVARMLTRFPDELERDNYLEAVCARHAIPRDALRDLVRRVSAAGPLPEPRPFRREPAGRGKREKEKEEGLLEAQRLLLSWAYSEKEGREELKRYLTPEDFPDEVCREAADLLWSRPQAAPASLMDRFAEDEEKNGQAAALFSAALPDGCSPEEGERILAESVRRVKRASLEAAMRRETDPVKVQEMIGEKSRLETEPIPLGRSSDRKGGRP